MAAEPCLRVLAILNTEKANVLISPKPYEIERFCRNFRPKGYLRNVLFAIFKKFSPPQKWRPF